MSGPVVAIGFILLIPSLIGIAISLIMFIASMSATASYASARPGASLQVKKDVIDKLRQADVFKCGY